MNSINITGRLTKDPELRTTQNGTSVCSFTVAVSRPHVKDTTDFFDCVAWRQTGEFVSKYFSKGRRIGVSGVMTSRKWEDKDGNKRTAWEVLVNDVEFGDSKQESKPADDWATTDDEEGLPF